MIGTTVKQSKVLMGGGLDTSTADLAYIKNPRDGKYLLVATPPLSKSDIPCWSMGALWEICRQRGINLEFTTDEDSVEEVITTMVMKIFDNIDEKSNLEFIKNIK